MENLKEIDSVTKTTLPNGLRIVTEKIESVKSISVGIWVKTGSRNETPKPAGGTHFFRAYVVLRELKKEQLYDIPSNYGIRLGGLF